MTDSIPARLLHPGRSPRLVREGGRELGAHELGLVRPAGAIRRQVVDRPGAQSRQATCILGFNRPEWVIFDVATMMAGGALAGIYTTCSPSEVQYIVSHSESRIVLLEDAAQWEKVRAERDRLPQLAHVVMMRGAPAIDDPLVMSWDAFLQAGEDLPEQELDNRIAALQPDQVATFIYTSGTTGPPKAVMLSHANLTWTASVARDLTDLSPSDSSLSYLPLSHIAEQMFSIHGPITVGSSIWFAESVDAVADNLKEVQPTVVFGVPRIWEKMHAKVAPRLAEVTGVKRWIADFALATGRVWSEVLNRGEHPGLRLELRHHLAHKLLFSKLKPLLGLGRARVCVSGAAPISAEVLAFFAALDLRIHEVYGQSEDTGPTTFNVPGRTKFGTVGRPLPGTEVRIADDGEILVRGPHVFLGYSKDPEATAEALVDGWLRSGDLGSFDDDGFLVITGRKKEILITAGGKNIAPKNIESALRDLPLVAQAVVIGDRRRYLTALITLDLEASAAFSREHKLPLEALHEHPVVLAELQRGIDQQVHPQFARVEHVRRFSVLHRDFSIEEGELTPTLKIKRRVVEERFAEVIEAMYEEGERASAK